MKFIIIVFFLFFGLYLVLFYKHYSPYKMWFLFGKKGAGKSTFMIKLMLQYKKKGWNIYTDMLDVRIPGVRYFKTFDLATFVPEENSAVFLDEAGLSFSNRDFKSLPKGIKELAALQRKYKLLIVANSQSYDIDKVWRDRADKLFLLNSFGRISIIRPIRRSITLTEASSMGESRVADQLKFSGFLSWRFLWLPKYYKFFESFNPPFRDSLPYVAVTCDKESEADHRPMKMLFKMISRFLGRK